MMNETTRGSSGVAKAGLTLGIIGTSLAGLLWANGNGGRGILGGSTPKEEALQDYACMVYEKMKEHIAEAKGAK